MEKKLFFSTGLTYLDSVCKGEILAKQLMIHLLTFLNTGSNDSAFADQSFFLVEKMQAKQGLAKLFPKKEVFICFGMLLYRNFI